MQIKANRVCHRVLLFSVMLTGCLQKMTEEDFCGKTFKYSNAAGKIGIVDERKTTLNCDGTFISGYITRQNGAGIVDNKSNQFIGKWSLVNNVPEDVVAVIKKDGFKLDEARVIKYWSNNGIDGYCIYTSVNNHYGLIPLYLGQISMDSYETSGSLGIWEGFSD